MASEYILGIDYGSKRVGIAIVHSVARLPRPLTTILNSETICEDIQNIINKESVQLVVVGLPRGMDGGYTEQTRVVEAFAAQLKSVVSVPVELCDETLTSVDAETILGPGPHVKMDIDALAASLILERYLSNQPAERLTIS